MDKKILGNFIIYFPIIAYFAFRAVIKDENSEINWTSIIIGALIGMISYAVGTRIKNNGEVIKLEAHPIPEHPRPRRVVGRMALVGDAAGYVTKSSGEGIYFAAKSGRMCAEQIVEDSKRGEIIPSENDLKKYLQKWDKQYGTTYKVLEILQNIFYRNDAAREAFVEMCDDKDVQRLTFDSYLYKRVVPMKPWQQIKLTMLTLGSWIRGRALTPETYKPVPSAVRKEEEINKMMTTNEIKGIKLGKKRIINDALNESSKNEENIVQINEKNNEGF